MVKDMVCDIFVVRHRLILPVGEHFRVSVNVAGLCADPSTACAEQVLTLSYHAVIPCPNGF